MLSIVVMPLLVKLFHGLAGNLGLCACVLHVTMGLLIQLPQKFCACRRMVIISAEFGGKKSHEVGVQI